MTSDGSRFLATTKDEALLTLLCDGDPIGPSIVVRSGGKGNLAALG